MEIEWLHTQSFIHGVWWDSYVCGAFIKVSAIVSENVIWDIEIAVWLPHLL